MKSNGPPPDLGDIVERWRLTIDAVQPPFELSYNYVVAVRQADGAPAVLKVRQRIDDELRREILALRLYAGQGACQLLRADETRGALLLERIVPGETLVALAALDDDQATRIAARVMRAVWRPLPEASGFQPLADWFKAFEEYRARYGAGGPISAGFFGEVERRTADLFASVPRRVVLHGDLQHYNVLSKGSGWVAVDPKGVEGDPGYEVGPFLYNPSGPPTSVPTLRRRLLILADELAYPRGRLRDWGAAYGLLSACWSLEVGDSAWQAAAMVAARLLEL